MTVPNNEKWPSLLGGANAILGHYREIENATLRLGGGTALTFFVDHRNSFDLDFFVGFPAPRGGHLQRLMSSGFLRTLTEDIRFPGHYIKLVWKDVGEIDLLAAAPLSIHDGTDVIVNSVSITLEHPEEIVAKKLAFRASKALGRDLYDIHVCVAEGLVNPSNLSSLVGPEQFDALLEAMKYDARRIEEELERLDGRRFDCSISAIRESVEIIARARPGDTFEISEPTLNFRHLEARLGLDIESVSARKHGND